MHGIITKSIMIFILIAACLHTVSASPPIPESYWGYATINGAPAAIGTLITVEIHNTGQIIESTTVQYENGGYSLDIEFDDPDTPEDEGADEGDKLTWKLGGVICATPAPSIDTVTSGKTNGNFNLVIKSNEQESFGGISSGRLNENGTSDEPLEDEQPIATSKGTVVPINNDQDGPSQEMPVGKKSDLPGFSFIGVIFVLFILTQILKFKNRRGGEYL